MNAYELADELAFKNIVGDDSGAFSSKIIIMLRQQAKEIDQLNFVLKNLTLATNKKINELEEEIEHLKNKVQYWKGLHR
jgi:polyhydroxyalkanoate synthesis regulator phasin